MLFGIQGVLDSIRQIANRWLNTQVALIEDANAGDTIITVRNTARFLEGDEFLIMSPVYAGIFHTVDEVIDDTHLLLQEAVMFNWTVAANSIIHKTFNGQMLAGIYYGEHDNIPMFPAVTIAADSLDSEWMTIDSTKENYNFSVMIYTKAAAQEKGYKAVIQLADTLIYGLKRNLYPLVSPYKTTAVTAAITSGDHYIKVADSTIFTTFPTRIIIEDEWKQSEIFVQDTVDDTTLFVQPAPSCNFALADSPQVILMERFIFNSWPSNATYGDVFKGTLLKAAKISWFAHEEKIESGPPRETYLH